MTSERIRRPATPGRAAAAVLGLLLVSTPAAAQIARDGSIGPADTGIDFFDPMTSTWRITEDLGAQSGGNLYHSFSEFSIPFSQTAEFSWKASSGQPRPPARVISRVTGGSRSFLRGVLSLGTGLGAADFFLLNPAGVSMSTGAQLDVGGSVYLSSADQLRFADGAVLEASQATPPPLLSAASPSAFGFATDAPSDIRLSNLSELRAPAGEKLVVVGAGIRVSNSFGDGIRAPGASVVLASVGGPTEVPVDAETFDVSGAAPEALGSVALVGNARIDASSEGLLPAGSVVIRAGRFELAGSITADHDLDGVQPIGGIDVAVRDSITIERNSVARTSSLISTSSNSDQRAGDISLRAASVEIEQGTVFSENLGPGSGGSIEVSADSITVSTGGQIASANEGPGAAGSIELAGTTLTVADGGLVASDASGTGPGGSILVMADEVVVSNDAGAPDLTAIAAQTSSPSVSGRGGDLTIDAGFLEITGGGQILTNTDGAADAGNLRVVDADRVRVHGRDAALDQLRPSGITTRALENATADAKGGLLSIDAALLEVEDGAQISSATFGRGQAGALMLTGGGIVIRGGDQFGPALLSSASFPGVPREELGPGGALTIEADSLALIDGGQISTAAAGAGDAGTARIQADRVSIQGADPRFGNPSGIFGLSDTAGVANGGRGADFTITAEESLALADGGRITVETRGSGAAGRIVLDGDGDLGLGSGASISAVSTAAASGDPGTIEIRNARFVSLSGGSEIAARIENPTSAALAGGILIEDVGGVALDGGASISTETAGTTTGGSIDIRANESVTLTGGATIDARSTGAGDAGDITVDAGQLFAASESASVTTESVLASGGVIDIGAVERIALQDVEVTTSVLSGAGGGGDVALSSGLVVLNRSLVKAEAIDGRGGNITIFADLFVASGDSVVSATSETGIDGDVIVNAPGSELVGKVAKLPVTFLDAASLLRSSCAARTARVGSFVVEPRRVVLTPPDLTTARGPALAPAAVGVPAECPSWEEP